MMAKYSLALQIIISNTKSVASVEVINDWLNSNSMWLNLTKTQVAWLQCSHQVKHINFSVVSQSRSRKSTSRCSYTTSENICWRVNWTELGAVIAYQTSLCPYTSLYCVGWHRTSSNRCPWWVISNPISDLQYVYDIFFLITTSGHWPNI